VVVQRLVVVRADVAAREHLLEMLEERGVHRHHVLEVAVDGTVLHHQNLAVALEDRRFDLADLLVEENADVLLPVENRLARLAHTGGAQRVGLARPPEWRLGLFVRLQEWFVRPRGDERRVLFDLVQTIEDRPRAVRRNRQPFLHVLDWLVHALNLRGGMAYEDYIFSERAERAANGRWPGSDGHLASQAGLAGRAAPVGQEVSGRSGKPGRSGRSGKPEKEKRGGSHFDCRP
jgi:hypothetical protein